MNLDALILTLWLSIPIISVLSAETTLFSPYMYGILDEKDSSITYKFPLYNTDGEFLENKEINIILSRYENLEVRASLICYRSLRTSCPEEIITHYRTTLIEPYLKTENKYLVPRRIEESSLSIREVNSIREFVKLFSPVLCYNDAASLSYKRNIANTFTRGERHVWQNRNFFTNTYYTDLQRVYTPCLNETKWWVEGKVIYNCNLIIFSLFFLIFSLSYRKLACSANVFSRW